MSLKSRSKKILIVLLLTLFLSPVVTALDELPEPESSPGPRRSGLPILIADYPGSLFRFAAETIFKHSAVVSLSGKEVPLDSGMDPLIQLMWAHEAYPYMESNTPTLPRLFSPLYRSTLVISTDPMRCSLIPSSWNDLTKLADENVSVGILVPPEMMIASMRMSAAAAHEMDHWLSALAVLHQNDRLKLYAGPDRNTGWPMALLKGELKADMLPEVLILWDYQAAQMNYRLKEDRYEFHVPEEGGLMIESGLMAQGGEALSYIQENLKYLESDEAAATWLRFGYRLSDGRSAGSPNGIYTEAAELLNQEQPGLGYPEEAEYRNRQLRIKDYRRFNSSLMRESVTFRKKVVGVNPLLPASQEQEQMLLILSVPFFLIWIATIYYRLDDAAIKRPMGILLFWLSVFIILHFMQVMYSNSISGHVLNYMRFLPVFGMVESWFYTGISLAGSRRQVSPSLRKNSWILTLIIYTEAILFISNEFHGHSFTLNVYMQITKVGPVFYISFVTLILTAIGGTWLLALSQRMKKRGTLLLPFLIFLLSVAGNFYFFHHGGSIRSSVFDLMNSATAILFLESCLLTHFIPVNTGYFVLFRNSPVKLRLLSEDLNTLYPEAGADLPMKNLHRIKTAIRDKFPARENASLKQRWWKRKRAQKSQLTELLKIKDTRKTNIIYNVGQVSGGYLIWEDDISDIIRLKDELTGITERLEQQSKILTKQKDIRSQYLSMSIRRRMLHDIEDSLSQKMNEMSESFTKIQQNERDRDFVKHELSRVKLMVSQCKRKSNLLVRSEEMISVEEMNLILKEALSDAVTGGIRGISVCRGDKAIPVKTVLMFYDYLQFVLQKAVDQKNPQLFITFTSKKDSVIMQLLHHADEVTAADFFKPDQLVNSGILELNASLQIDCEEKETQVRLVFREGQDD